MLMTAKLASSLNVVQMKFFLQTADWSVVAIAVCMPECVCMCVLRDGNSVKHYLRICVANVREGVHSKTYVETH